MSFEEIGQIFGKVSADWSAPPGSPLKPFLFHALAAQNDRNSLEITVTDFQSNTFQAIKSHLQLEDMRDAIGIGGSWSDFVDYIKASLKSEDVKLVMEGSSESGGAARAKLIAQKAKGMPRVSISLGKLVDGAANKAMGNLSLELYTEYKTSHYSLIEEKECSHRLTKIVADEQEKKNAIQKQLDSILYSRKHKSQKVNVRADLDAPETVSQDSPDKKASPSPGSTKVSNRVVPVHRRLLAYLDFSTQSETYLMTRILFGRSKVRGVVLEDTEND